MSAIEPVELSRAYLLLNHGPTVLVTSAHGAERNVCLLYTSAWIAKNSSIPVGSWIRSKRFSWSCSLEGGRRAAAARCGPVLPGLRQSHTIRPDRIQEPTGMEEFFAIHAPIGFPFLRPQAAARCAW